ncbi:MAG: rRNA-binding ribosome biosynthesis protein rpf2 [Cirrosporium novae-zelandiae]|nr:MAG: rRNA-binding ribosome biosynthesis protein rpf2 [Cirrosporium novae-zelandiae]
MATPVAPFIKEIKPRNARSKRELAKRAPLVKENPKKALFLEYTKCSQPLHSLMTDLCSIKKPFSVRFNKKNDVHPFESTDSLEWFSLKNDASLLVFGSHSKKRPHCLTMIRTFNHKVLDMMEFLVVEGSLRTMGQFGGGRKASVGAKPLLAFQGAIWEDQSNATYTQAKSLLLDFFRGEEVQTIDVEGLNFFIAISTGESVMDQPSPLIRLRVYLIKTKRSGQRLPRVELEEMGPRVDLRIGRIKEPEEAVMREALKKPKGTEERPKKNIETDIMGDKLGRIHLGRQDLKGLQTRKMKGLKRSRDVEEDMDDDQEDIISTDEEGDVGSKRYKAA